MNLLRQDKLAKLIDGFGQGMSGRAAARYAGCSQVTAWKLSKSMRLRRACPCGKFSDHRGWCAFRFAHSPARMSWMRTAWPATAPNPYRFKPGPAATDPLMDAIKASVPRGLPAQVRDEVYQDIAVAVLAGEIAADGIAAVVSAYVKAVFRKYPLHGFGTLSLDQPRGHWDNRPLKDTLPTSHTDESGM